MISNPPSDGAQPLGAGAVPVCPRHPDRASYVRCQRCERPVCPQCQRVAAVGVQCVDCVKAAAKSGPVVRTVFGGRAVGGRPVVTLTLVGVTVAAFGLQMLLGNSFTLRFAFAPYLALAEPWRFLTAAFLHSPSFLLHIAFNMYALWLTGPYLENLMGRGRFLALYLISGLGGSVGYFVLAPETWDGVLRPTVGASGAVFGLFAALLVVNRRLGRETGSIIVLLGVNLVLGFVVSGIAWQAHLGGLATGAACAAVLAQARSPRRTTTQTVGLVLIVAVLVTLVGVKAALMPSELLA